MEGAGFVGELVLLIAIAAGAAALFERLRLPAIAGFLVTGALVGPGGLGIVGDPDTVLRLAELGVVFLLFEIGLELPVDRVSRLWRRAALAGGLQVALTVAVVSGSALAVGLDPARALVLGALVAMSSTALVMRVLSDRGEIDAPHGQLSVGILLFQDLCIVPLLLVVPLLSQSSNGAAVPVWPLVRAFLALVVFFVVARFGLPKLLDRVIALRSRDAFTLVAFLVVLGSAWVAEAVGLTLAVGAFVGGLVLSASPYAYQLFAEVLPLRGVLIGIFFTAVGMLLDPRVAFEGWSAVIAYVTAVVVIKTGIVAAIVALALRQSWRLGLITGLGLAQTGEFSFVLAAVASEAGLLDSVMRQVFVAGSIVTLVATPFMAQWAPRLGRLLAGVGGRVEEAGRAEASQVGHVVLLGCGFAGQTVIRVLHARGIPYVGAEANASIVQSLRARGEPVHYGDVTRRALLERTGVARARLVVVTVSDPIATREAVRLVRQLAPDVPVVARTHFVLQVDPLYAVGASAVVAEEFESTLEVLSRSLQAFGLPEATVARFVEELRQEGYEPLRTPELALDPWLGELLEEASAQWIEVESDPGPGASLASLAIRARTGCSVLAVEHGDERVVNPEPDQAIALGDRLLALGRPPEIERLVALVCAQSPMGGSRSSA